MKTLLRRQQLALDVSGHATTYQAGLIVVVGSEVTDLHEGQRVGWLTGRQGSFADYAVVVGAPTTTFPLAWPCSR